MQLRYCDGLEAEFECSKNHQFHTDLSTGENLVFSEGGRHEALAKCPYCGEVAAPQMAQKDSAA